jgi:hypothetical protein
MKRLMSLAFVFFVAISNFTSESQAAPVEVGFTGIINEVNDPDGYLPAGFFVGSPFSGTYIVDSVPLGPPIFDFGPDVADYPFDNSASIDANVGGSAISVFGTRIQIGNDPLNPFGDQWSNAGLGNGFNCVSCVLMGLGFNDSTRLRLSDTSYFVNTSLAGWDGAGINFLDSSDFGSLALGAFTEIHIVPEPSAALLVGLGLVGLASRRR